MQTYHPSRPSPFACLKSVLPLSSLIGRNPFATKPPKLKITREAHEAIRKTVGTLPSETGGMLGGDREKGVITHFHFDGEARTSGATYSPNHELLGSLLKSEWNPKGVKLMGFVHSHPRFCTMPSEGDRLYAKVLLDANDEIEALHLPIVMSGSGGAFELLPFVAMRDGAGGVKILPTKVEIIGAPERTEIGETFARVSDLYDLARLDRCRVIAVGAGGAAAFLEDIARSGVGELVLIDPDTVSVTNLATQQVYRQDIGRPKVEAIRERLLDINPNARVEIRQAKDVDLDDAEFERLIHKPLGGSEQGPVQTVLCGFTDKFAAQARVNRLALHFGIPSLCAQLYAGGKQMELTYTYPGLTRSCHRCIFSSRYTAYLEESYVNDVGSQGTPIFATARLNALKGYIIMGLLHYDAVPGTDSHPARKRWTELLNTVGQRNLAWIRTDPSVAGIFSKLCVEGSDNIVFDETLWRVQTPDGPLTGRATCPDCGGTGDLRMCKGTFEDTRPMSMGLRKRIPTLPPVHDQAV